MFLLLVQFDWRILTVRYYHGFPTQNQCAKKIKSKFFCDVVLYLSDLYAYGGTKEVQNRTYNLSQNFLNIGTKLEFLLLNFKSYPYRSFNLRFLF